VLRSAQQRFDLKTPRGKRDAVEEVLPIIADLASPVERAHYVQRLATLTGVDERTLTAELPKSRRRTDVSRVIEPALAAQGNVNASEILEDYCLSLLFRLPFLRSLADRLMEDHFQATETRELFRYWQSSEERWAEDLPELLRERLQRIENMPLPTTAERLLEAALVQCMQRLEERRLREIKHLHRLHFFEEDHQNAIATQSYHRYKFGSGVTEDGSVTGLEDTYQVDPLLLDVQENEVLVNKRLQEMMKLKHSGAQGSP